MYMERGVRQEFVNKIGLTLEAKKIGRSFILNEPFVRLCLSVDNLDVNLQIHFKYVFPR